VVQLRGPAVRGLRPAPGLVPLPTPLAGEAMTDNWTEIGTVDLEDGTVIAVCKRGGIVRVDISTLGEGVAADLGSEALSDLRDLLGRAEGTP
jgi:hypothetical protein